MEPLTIAYAVYTVVAITLTAALARILYRTGRLFLDEVFPDSRPLAAGVNSLLVVGFTLVTLGYSFVIFGADPAATRAEAFETLVERLGALLLSLGVIHFATMAVFWRLRANALAPAKPQRHTMPPPPPPPSSRAYGPIASR